MPLNYDELERRPVTIAEVFELIRRARRGEQLEAENSRLKKTIGEFLVVALNAPIECFEAVAMNGKQLAAAYAGGGNG